MTAAKKATAAKTNPTLESLDPGTLVIAANVRTETKISAEFVANIKLNGVIVPILAERDADGIVEVTDGQRRTLAAVQAGLKLVPVFIVSASDSAATRLLTQITVNDQREGLDEAEHVAAYKQLSLFGLPAASIAKVTGAKKERVQRALDVAGNEVAAAALADTQLTLDQAAQLVAFADDPDAIKVLTKIAETEPARFDHAVRNLQDKRDVLVEAAKLQEQLVAEGVVVLEATNTSYAGSEDGPEFVRLERIAFPMTPTVPVTAADLVGHPGLAGRVVTEHRSMPDRGYCMWPAIQYLLLKEHSSDFVELAYERKPLTPQQQADADAREVANAARSEKRAALSAAAEVRAVWLAEFFQRAKLPTATEFIAEGMTFGLNGTVSDLALDWMGIKDDGENRDRSEVAREYLAANRRKSERFMLAVIMADNEECMSTAWNLDPVQVASYMTQLKAWGYGLSEVEQAFIDPQATD